MMKEVSEANRHVANHVARAFGGTPQVREYLDDMDPVTLDILWCDDRPYRGVTSYSTIGLSDHGIPWGHREFPVRLELASACASSVECVPRILASAAFRMMRTGDVYHPGAAIEGPVRLYMPSSPLPYLYFTAPFLWENLKTFDAGTKKVTWLLAVLISSAEQAYLTEQGDHALERLFEEHQIDIFDVNRASVV